MTSFLKRKNIEFSVKRYLVDALGAMALGLFASLIVGLILETIGEGIANLGVFEIFAEAMIVAGGTAKSMMGPAIGVAVAYGLGAPPLVMFAGTITGSLGAQFGGPVGAFIGAVVGTEIGKIVSKETKIDIIVTPSITILAGFLGARLAGPGVSYFMLKFGELVMTSTELHPIPMGIVVATLMGLALTAPISSAALAIIMELSGLAAGAATVGCAAQMVGFAVISYRENGVGGLFSQGLGTSMLQIANVIKKPLIILPPTLAGAIIGPFATTIFSMDNIKEGAGMGTSGLVGQFGTWVAMGGGVSVFIKILLLHFILPAILSLIFYRYLIAKNLIKSEDYKLDL